VLAAAGAALIAAIVVFVVAGGGSSNPPVGPIPASAATATTAATTTSTTASGSGNANVLDTLTLSSPTSGSKASGAAEVIQSGSKQVLAFSASGLPSPGSGHYVLWLYSSASKYKPLGEISSVKNGTVSPVGVTLPADASSYTGVVLTLVSASKPSSPGPIVLLGTGTTPL
jgi:hypothetical protein